MGATNVAKSTASSQRGFTPIMAALRPLRLFVTGGTGFIGRTFLNHLDPHSFEVSYLTRQKGPERNVSSTHERRIHGALEDPGSYSETLAKVDVVVHLAAVTGKARRQDYFRVNVLGTRILLEQCQRTGPLRFVYVSSIAAGLTNAPFYHYAVSKKQAEEAVRESRLPYVIVRPTIVLGHGSPILQALARLASAPVIPVFGDGRTRVQPILVDDLAACLVDLARDQSVSNETFDLGGPDVLSFESLLHCVRRALGRNPARVVHLPAGPAIAVLAALERIALRLLPVTAGQISAFVNDSVARSNWFLDQRLGRMSRVEEMVRPAAAHV
jgi:nucleoside-diphosphate-sugar epimerase